MDALTTPTPVPAALAPRLALAAAKLGDVVQVHAAPGLAALGLTGIQYAVLALLADDEPGSQQELAAALSKVPAVIVGLLDDLEARGLVERRRSREDRRRTQPVITPAGKGLLAQADGVAASVEDELFAGLGPDERAALQRAVLAALARGWTPCGAP